MTVIAQKVITFNTVILVATNYPYKQSIWKSLAKLFHFFSKKSIVPEISKWEVCVELVAFAIRGHAHFGMRTHSC